MGTRLEHLIRILNDIAPFSMKEDWDNPGLQVGDPAMEVKKILVSLDPNETAIMKAREIDAQVLLTHHPLLFHELKTVNRDAYPGNLIYMAIENRIAIVSVHTNLDMSNMGINRILGKVFSLENLEPLKKYELISQEGAGIGILGDLNPPMELEQFLIRAKEILGIKVLKVSGSLNKRINRMAIVGGSGGQFLSIAKERRADLLLTGDTTHHQALEAERIGITLVDGGHFFTEATAMKVFSKEFGERLNEMELDITVVYFDEEKEPYMLL